MNAITSIRCNLVLVARDRVRVTLSLIPDGAVVSTLDLESLPTDGSPVVDDISGTVCCLWELDIATPGTILAHARRELEIAYFAAHEPHIRAVRLDSVVAYALAGLLATVRRARAAWMPTGGSSR